MKHLIEIIIDEDLRKAEIEIDDELVDIIKTCDLPITLDIENTGIKIKIEKNDKGRKNVSDRKI
mgnify:CR=1 FL=1